MDTGKEARLHARTCRPYFTAAKCRNPPFLSQQRRKSGHRIRAPGPGRAPRSRTWWPSSAVTPNALNEYPSTSPESLWNPCKPRPQFQDRGNPTRSIAAPAALSPRISTHPPKRHCASRVPACGRRWRFAPLPSRNTPLLQHSHIHYVRIWKSRTLSAPFIHAVSPRIPTSPQQTTTTAIYTYPLKYFVVAVVSG